jgi:hypothetical protein
MFTQVGTNNLLMSQLPTIPVPTVYSPRSRTIPVPTVYSPRSPTIPVPTVYSPRSPTIVSVPKLPTVYAPQLSTVSIPTVYSPKSPIVSIPRSPTVYSLPIVSVPKLPTIYSPPILSVPKSPTIYSPRSSIVSVSKLPTASVPTVYSKQSLSNDFIQPLPIHKEYGVIDIPGIKVINIAPSTRANKKYAITVEYKGVTKTIHYGNDDYGHYEDRTPLKTYAYLNHYDEKRRRSYLARSSKITSKYGDAANYPFSANRYAIITLW